MNTQMWHSPFTAKHLTVLTQELKCDTIGPIEQLLECLDYGKNGMQSVTFAGLGAMSKPPEILARVKETLPAQEVLVARRTTVALLMERRKLILAERIKASTEQK